MPKIEVDHHHYLEFRDTPWDSVCLGYPTREVLDIQYKDIHRLVKLLKELNIQNVADGIRYCNLRIDAKDFQLKEVLQQEGFSYVETSHQLSASLRRIRTEETRRNPKFVLEPPTEYNINQIVDIAATSFKFGRFQEDFAISHETSSTRFQNWIRQMITEKTPFLIYRSNETVVSFMAYQVNQSQVELILGGSAADHGFISVYFWHELLEEFQRRTDLKTIWTLVSAANVGILNLYASFGFKVSRTYLGFRKFYPYVRD